MIIELLIITAQAEKLRNERWTPSAVFGVQEVQRKSGSSMVFAWLQSMVLT